MTRRGYSTRTVVVGCAVVLGILLLGARWVFSDARGYDNAHDDALELWESHGPASYSFDYQECSGMCGPCPVHVTVHDGEVTDAVGSGEGCSFDSVTPPTVEDLFAAEKEARGSDHGSLWIYYDPTWGYPKNVSINCPGNGDDCGWGFDVSHFRAEPS